MTRNSAGWKHWTGASMIAAGIALVLLALTTTTTLWDRDEPRFAQAAVEMLSSGDYLLPTFNGELRPQKPPLIYWLMTLSLRTFGQTETAVRMWSPIAIAVAALATFAIGRRFWSVHVGLVAMVVLALTPLTVVHGAAATTDAVLLASLTVSLAIASAGLCRPVTPWHVAGLGLALGIGTLAKGPVAIVLPVPIIALACWLAHRSKVPRFQSSKVSASARLVLWRATARPRRSGPMCLGAGREGGPGFQSSGGHVMVLLALSTTIAVAMFAAWFVPATLASAREIATQGLLRENIGRLLEPMDGHGTPMALAPVYYPAVIAVGFLPWVVYLPAALRRIAASRSWATPRDALLLTWIAWPLVLFTISATKLPHYILPLWPALALCVAVVLVENAPSPGRLGSIPRRLIAVSVIATLGLGLGLAPLLERYKPVPHIMASVQGSTVLGPIFAYAFEEPSLVFYGRRPLVRLHGDAALSSWVKMPGEALLIAPRAAIDAVERTHGSLGLREVAARRGWNYVKGERVELVAFVRPSDR